MKRIRWLLDVITSAISRPLGWLGRKFNYMEDRLDDAFAEPPL